MGCICFNLSKLACLAMSHCVLDRKLNNDEFTGNDFNVSKHVPVAHSNLSPKCGNSDVMGISALRDTHIVNVLVLLYVIPLLYHPIQFVCVQQLQCLWAVRRDTHFTPSRLQNASLLLVIFYIKKRQIKCSMLSQYPAAASWVKPLASK